MAAEDDVLADDVEDTSGFTAFATEDEEDENLVPEGLTGTATIGGAAIGLDKQSFKFREYSNLKDDGGFFQGDADLSYYRDSYFMNFTAKDLGLENRSLFFENGKLGDYRFFVEFDQLPHLLSNTSKSFFNGIGGTSLTLPGGFGTGFNTPALTFTGIKKTDLKLDDRVTTSLGFAKTFGEDKNNEFELSYRRATKNGLQSLGAPIGTNPGNVKTVVLPEPVNQTSNEVEARLAHNGEDFQLQLDYFLSLFNNKKEFISFESPFAGSLPFFLGFPGSFGPAPTNGLISRPPDNQSHRVSLSGGLNLPASTRISGVFEYGLMKQDEKLFPFAVGTSTNLLPRQTADTKMENLHFNLNLSSRPLAKLRLTAKYRYHQTINRTPRTLFLTVVNDTGGQVTDNEERALFNLPFDYRRHQINTAASYNLFKATNVKLGYDIDIWNRDFREVKQTIENTFKVGFKSNYFSRADIYANVSYSDKFGDSYDATRLEKKLRSQKFLTTNPQAAGFAILPELRKFDIAERERVRMDSNINFFISESMTLGINYIYLDDNYVDSILGLTSSQNNDGTVDFSYSPAEGISYHAYYNFNENKSRQNGRSHNFFDPTSRTNLNRNWQVGIDDVTNTIGLGAQLKFWENRLSLNTDYGFSQGVTFTGVSAGSDPDVADPGALPNLKTTRHTFETTMNYQYTPNLSLGLSYLYENYQSDQFSTDGFSGASSDVADVILISSSIPAYQGHIGMVFATYQFGNTNLTP